MSKRKLYLGPQLRRLRRDRNLTQAELAAAIGVSASYANLMERNQRPISAEVLIRLAQVYGLDVGDLDPARADGLFAGLAEAFADPLIRASGATREDAFELAAGNPVLAEGVLGLYRAWRAAQNELLEARAAGRTGAEADPVEEARSFIQIHRNHFPEVDAAAEAIAGEISRDHPGDLGGARLAAGLADRFARQHSLTVRLLSDEVMAGAYRRLNRHTGDLIISERLDQASRTFQLALQLCLIELQSMLDKTVNQARFETDSGRRLARSALANYAAGAVLLPYTHFLASAKELRYDLEALSRRFGASFEQIAHRVATLQRPGAEGISFFFLRVDAAGNISKRFSGDVFPFARYGGSCPLWNVHETFRNPRKILTQIIELPDGSQYFSIARTVHGGVGGYGAPRAERAVALGCRLEDADALVYAGAGQLGQMAPAPIGITCRLCERGDCAARAHPPLRRRIVVDEHRRFSTPFSFEFD